MTLAVKNAKIVLENETIYDGILLIEDGKIKKFGNSNDIDIPDGSRIRPVPGRPEWKCRARRPVP